MTRGIAVLGAGLAGLALSGELAEAGVKPDLFEARSDVGGLIRTDRYGDFAMDRLAQAFFTYNQSIVRFFERVVAGRRLVVGRTQRVYRGGRVYLFPPPARRLPEILGTAELARVLADYTAAQLAALVRQPTGHNLLDWASWRFGRRFAEAYLGPYVEKVWGLPPSRVSAEWGVKRIAVMGLFEALRRARRGRRHAHTAHFFYVQGGIGFLTARLAERLAGQGVRLQTGCEVVRLFHRAGKVVAVGLADGREVEADRVVSTLPPGSLVAMLDPPAPEKVVQAAGCLRYRSVVVVQLEISRPQVTDAVLSYFADPDVPFTRMQEPGNKDPSMSPSGRTSLCLEVYCDRGDALWAEPSDALIRRCVDHLAGHGLVQAQDVTGSHVVRLRSASPVFYLGYRADRQRVLDHLAHLANLYLVGRTATYSYRSMDEVLEEAIAVAPLVLRGARHLTA